MNLRLNLLILFIIFFSSCQRVEDADPKEMELCSVSFHIRVPTSNNYVNQTRALTEADENKIKNITLLLFDENDNLALPPYYIYQITDTDIINIKTFKTRIPKGTYTVEILCNVDQIVKTLNPLVGISRESLNESLIFTNTRKWKASTATDAYLMPMWGQVRNVPFLENMTLQIKLLRMLAKLDLQIMGSATSVFTLRRIYLININTNARIAPLMTSLDSPDDYFRVTNVSLPSDPGYESAYFLYEDEVKDNRTCLNEIYIFEKSKDDTYKTSLIIEGGRYGFAVSYILPLKQMIDGTLVDIDVLRNKRYSFEISNIKSNGYNSLDQAINALNHTRAIDDVCSGIDYKLTVIDESGVENEF